MYKLIQEEEKVNSPIIFLNKLFSKMSGRLGISFQMKDKEFFVGVLMQEVEIEKVIKRKNKKFVLHKGQGRVLDL